MEVLLQNTLPLKGNHEDLMWMYTEKPDIWCKFTQYVPINVMKVNEVPAKVYEVPVKVNEVPVKVNEVPSKVQEVPPKVQEVPAKVNEVQPKVHEVPANINEVPPKVHEDIAKIEKQDTKKNKKIDDVPKQTKNKKILPVEFIVQMSENNTMNIDYIKQELQAFISQKEFSKAFGVKKCSEVMSGITNNKWNKSLVLFLSFLFDKRFVYLNKEVVFDAEKCGGDLIHI